MRRHAASSLAVAAALGAALLAGCSSGAATGGGGPNPNDERGQALACLTGKRLPARAVGEREIVVGEGAGAPRIRYFTTSGEAEALQFEGGAEGAEQIGNALLWVKRGSDKLLDEIESCLNEVP